MEDGIFFNQSKYIKEMLKKFGLKDSKPTKTLMLTKIKVTKDDEADSVDSTKYQDEGKRADPPSPSLSSDENKEPSILEFYEELYDNKDLTDEQKEKRGMFKCLNRYFDTITKAKVTAIEKSNDLSSLALDELISNLKVHEVVMEKDSEIYKGKKERVKFIALKAKKESSDDETLTSGSDDEEYAIAVRNFKIFFRRKGKFIRQPREEKKSFRQRDDKKSKNDRK
ncbi:hypothetical protein Tco_0304937 [Tanacetum coccineum]